MYGFKPNGRETCCSQFAFSRVIHSAAGSYTFVPWLLSFKRGNALEEKENKIVVRKTGYFFIYSQVRLISP